MPEQSPSLTRRRVLQTMGAGAAAWAVAQGPHFNILRGPRAAAESGPDVYVVVLDDLSPEYVGFYQSVLPTAYPGPIHTPELDALFAESWTASSARATVAACHVSRASFLTGSSAAQVGLFGTEFLYINALIASRFLAKIASGELVSLPGLLTAQGFDTAVRGKIDHNGELFNRAGQIVEQGTFTSLIDLLNDPNYAPNGLPGSDTTGLPYAVLPDEITHVDALRVDEQIARINAPYTGQRVDFIGLVLPHTPRSVHQSWLDLYDVADIELRTTAAEIQADLADIPNTHRAQLEAPYMSGLPRAQWMLANLTDAQLKAHVHHMLASVSHASFQIGRLRDALDAAGRPYVMVVTSDHGYFMAEKGHYEKGTVYDKALRVPLAIHSSAGSVDYPVGTVGHPISLQGLPKTVAQLAGLDASLLPPQWGGRRFDDISGACLEHTFGANAETQSKALVWTAPSGHQFKIIVHPGDAGEVYDLTVDPGETDNLLVPNPPAGASPAAQLERAARRAEAEASLDLRARQLRVAEWRSRADRVSVDGALSFSGR